MSEEPTCYGTFNVDFHVNYFPTTYNTEHLFIVEEFIGYKENATLRDLGYENPKYPRERFYFMCYIEQQAFRFWPYELTAPMFFSKDVNLATPITEIYALVTWLSDDYTFHLQTTLNKKQYNSKIKLLECERLAKEMFILVEDTQIGGKEQMTTHYKGTIEPIDLIEAQELNFNRGNIIKYVCRAGKKENNTALSDLEKADYYLQLEIQKEKLK